jgi:alkylhydroperoxidase family enzyme
MFAELYITSPSSITDELFDELRRWFSEGQIVELCFFVGTYNMLQRFNTAIDLEPRAGEEIVVQSIGRYREAAEQA